VVPLSAAAGPGPPTGSTCTAGRCWPFGTAAPTDALNSGVSGANSVNALGAQGGRFLSTELDLGVQLRAEPWRSLLLSATVEGSLFLPGDAFKFPDGMVTAQVGLGRLVLSLNI
jgi:hypothetical protein